MDEQYAANIPTMSYVQREESKPDLGDFTLGEYTEKVILYGFLMVSLKTKADYPYRYILKYNYRP